MSSNAIISANKIQINAANPQAVCCIAASVGIIGLLTLTIGILGIAGASQMPPVVAHAMIGTGLTVLAIMIIGLVKVFYCKNQ